MSIVSVYGVADSYELVFEHVSGDNWAVNVPCDIDDGQYIVGITAVDDEGNTAFWTGILYMSKGICHMAMETPRLLFWLNKPRLVLDMRERDGCMFMEKARVDFLIMECRNILMYKGCRHAANRV